MTDLSPAAVEMPSIWRQIWTRFCNRLVRFRRRYIPMLVWYGDEVDVRLTFTENRLPKGMTFSPDDPGSIAHVVSPLQSGRLHEIEQSLLEIGVSFDTGMGFGGRDWDLDWSLKGPLRISMVGRAKRTERRT